MFTNRDIFVKQARRSQAFTLVELVLALAILMLLAGVLYAIVDTTLRCAADLEEKQDRNREMTAFLSLCRKTFANMPPTATFVARVIPDGQRYSSELIFRKAPGLLWWGDAGNASTSTILGVRGEVGGLVGLGILQDSEEQIGSYINGGTASRPWLMLLPGLRDAEWRFFDAGSSSWTKEWNNPMTRPAFAELTMTTNDGTHTYLFRIPNITNLYPGLP